METEINSTGSYQKPDSKLIVKLTIMAKRAKRTELGNISKVETKTENSDE